MDHHDTFEGLKLEGTTQGNETVLRYSTHPQLHLDS